MAGFLVASCELDSFTDCQCCSVLWSVNCEATAEWGSCNGNPPVRSFSGFCMLQGPFSFPPGCAHQGRGPWYPLKTGVSTQNCMTYIVAYTGHSTSCGKPLNWTQLVSSISSSLSLSSSGLPPFLLSSISFLSPSCVHWAAKLFTYRWKDLCLSLRIAWSGFSFAAPFL